MVTQKGRRVGLVALAGAAAIGFAACGSETATRACSNRSPCSLMRWDQISLLCLPRRCSVRPSPPEVTAVDADQLSDVIGKLGATNCIDAAHIARQKGWL